jgi:hypothetical protein
VGIGGDTSGTELSPFLPLDWPDMGLGAKPECLQAASAILEVSDRNPPVSPLSRDRSVVPLN